MWKEKLDKIMEELDSYGEQASAPATVNEIARLKAIAELQLKKELPAQYMDFLKNVNGIEFDGFIIYGVDKELMDNECNQPVRGIIENNLLWYEAEGQDKFLFLGESSISWYVHSPREDAYMELDKPSGSECDRFGEFNLMLNKILSDVLL